MKYRSLSLLSALVLVAMALALTACNKHGADTKPADVDYYTCTMHPSVKSQDPKAKCPICSMDLVPVMKRASVEASERGNGQASSNAATLMQSNSPALQRSDAPTEFTVPVARQQQIGVTYAAIEKRPLATTIRAIGSVAYDKQRHWDYVARVDGYIQKLFVFSRGELVEKDAPLLTIYSPDLLTTQNEFLDLLKTRDEARTKNASGFTEGTEHLVESAKQ